MYSYMLMYMSKILVTQERWESVNIWTQPYIAVHYAGRCFFCSCKKFHYLSETIRKAWVNQYLKLGGGWQKFKAEIKDWLSFRRSSWQLFLRAYLGNCSYWIAAFRSFFKVNCWQLRTMLIRRLKSIVHEIEIPSL